MCNGLICQPKLNKAIDELLDLAEDIVEDGKN